MAPPAYGSDVEVLYDGNNGEGLNAPDVTRDRTNPSLHTQGTSNVGDNKFLVDFENVFDPFDREQDDVREFFDETESHNIVDLDDDFENPNRVYYDPKKEGVLNEAVHQIAGSPWAKPASNPTTRPTDPLAIAKYASSLAFALTLGWVIYLLFSAIWDYTTIGKVIAEIILAILSFFGLFWNSYFTVSSIFKCFIPAKAFQTNTKYCSVVPEKKPKNEAWLDVTIQIPVYKESLQEVMMPTLKSCLVARNDYIRKSEGARCNIVICDDGMMAYLKNNFAAAEMLWETIEATKGKYFKLSQLLQKVPKPSRRHLKGLSSQSVYEVFHRMLFYYHYKIGFVARSTWDRRGKFKKASNLNSHLRLVWGAEQIAASENMSLAEALVENSHNSDGSRFTMFGGDVAIGHLILINDADARMSQSVIIKTVPEFLNDKGLGFTQHATKTLDDQRGESFYINMLSAYTDALYQGHFLLSSILGCHPPLVGHSIIMRSEAIKQCGRIRTLRKAQRWLNNIGLPFLSVDQIGSYNLQDNGSTEYWSESHVSEDFELMIHLYNLGFNGRYVCYPDCEFQEGITRTFDEEAGRHRKFALGAHELMFNPFNNWFGQGIFTPLFNTFLRSDIPSYYKVFLTAYLFSYTSGGAYLLVFSFAALARLLDQSDEVRLLSAFNSAGVLVMSMVVYYFVGYITFLFTMVKMKICNNSMLFPEYRNRGVFYLLWRMVRYCMFFQLLFYSVMGNYFFLGSMDHLMSKPGIVSATNKDSIKITRCTAICDVIRFNIGSWMIALYMLGLSYTCLLKDAGWDNRALAEGLFYTRPLSRELLSSLLFAAPAALMAVFALIIPLILNPFVLGFPFNPPLPCCRPFVKSPATKKKEEAAIAAALNTKTPTSGKVVDLKTFMAGGGSGGVDAKLDREIERVNNKPDVELGSLATNDVGGRNVMSVANPKDYRDSSRPTDSGRGGDPRRQSRPNPSSNPQFATSSAQQRPAARNRDASFKLAMI